MKINISIPGQPIAKARPRFRRAGKFVKTYSPQESEEGMWVLKAQQQIKDAGIFFNGLIEIRIRFYTQRPRSHFGSGKNANNLKASAPSFPDTSKDIDNYCKFTLDCLNHCGIWVDDAKIIGIDARHRFADIYGPGPSTEITITDQIEDETWLKPTGKMNLDF
jgi:Holliday junction resolvase RusA-like endonuclease